LHGEEKCEKLIPKQRTARSWLSLAMVRESYMDIFWPYGPWANSVGRRKGRFIGEIL